MAIIKIYQSLNIIYLSPEWKKLPNTDFLKIEKSNNQLSPNILS